MGESIGIDFGTTYSSITHLTNIKKDSKGNIVSSDIEAIKIGTKETLDTLVVDSNGERYFGTGARLWADSDPDAKTYKGFKMLLTEKRKELLDEYGYHTGEPSIITQEYLKYLINSYKSSTSGKIDIDSLVIGVPEVWYKTGIENRNMLQEMLEEQVGEGKVKLESEPVLACSFFAYKHKEKTGKDFIGKILLIDYGGGTLDIALCDIQKDKPIQIKYKTGEGANEQNKLGDAGLAFLEAVVYRAIDPQGVMDPQAIQKNAEFYAFEHRIENFLIENEADVTKRLKAGTSIKSELKKPLCPPIEYNKKRYVVTYEMLVKAYNETIFPVLAKCLNRVSTELKNRGIDYENPNSESFQIAMVGGFCNFYLTQAQIMKQTEGFKAGSEKDRRYAEFNSLLSYKENRKHAIGYGAALMANGIYTSASGAPYSLAIVRETIDKTTGKSVPDKRGQKYIVFREYDDIEYDTPQMVKGQDFVKGKAYTYEPYFSIDSIPWIQYVCDGLGGFGHPVGLDDLPTNAAIKLGFALDKNYNLTLYLFVKGESSPRKRILSKNIQQLCGGSIELREEDATI